MLRPTALRKGFPDEAGGFKTGLTRRDSPPACDTFETEQHRLGCNLNRRSAPKSASLIGALFLLIAALPLESAAEPAAPDAIVAEIGASAMLFNYHEYDDAGSILDKERGGIPGMSVKLGQRLAAWQWESIASYHHGRADYMGQTSTGVPYNTRTDETIEDIALRLGCCFDGNRLWILYGGLGYRRWDRDILPGTIGGMFESYRWPYIWLGTRITPLQDDQSTLVLDVGLLKPLSPELRVDFKGAYNASPVVHPESKIGLRMMLTSKISLSENTFLMLEPYYECWKLGRSAIVTTGGISVHEPASNTSNFGLNFRVARMF